MQELSIWQSSPPPGLVKFPVLGRIKATHSTTGGGSPSIPLSFSLETVLPPEHKDFDFSVEEEGADEVRVVERSPIPSLQSLQHRITRVSNPLQSPSSRP